ncbi:MAG TPA: tRNA (N6-threonylcarbamoyladenosine(37)-N6)-methyltransferase TrmO [Polyangiaceae bacterium]|nr:tRNA (N6-threonylcarbamoyladenosine(37)-N6)-methyltransferase TrmO [Polyangiaceae bacterium]
MASPYAFQPIGFVRSPYGERAAAPRQPSAALGVEATIELCDGPHYEHALEGLEEWEYVWVVFVFHRNVEAGRGWRPKVLPPRSARKRGVFATRSPHRPNPIGLSAVRLVGVEGRSVRVRNVDLLDGTPVLDLKPYVAYADAYPAAGAGWLQAGDPLPAWQVDFAPRARDQLHWLAERGIDLRAAIEAALSLGPEPHPYRRIRREGAAMRLALKDWRVQFEVDGRRIVVVGVRTGYRARQLAIDPALEVHRAFERACG